MTEVSKEAVEALHAALSCTSSIDDFSVGAPAEVIKHLNARGFIIARQQDCETSSGCVYADIKAYPPDGRCINAPALRYTAIPTGHDRGYTVTETSVSEAEIEREARELSLYAGNNSDPDDMTMSVLDAIKLAQKYRRM